MINNKYPTTKPSLNLDFANTKSLDPRINFRRGTPGTYYDGVTHAKAEENLLHNSVDNVEGSEATVNETTGQDAPNGTSEASLITYDGTNALHYAYIDGGSSNLESNTYTYSLHLKKGTQRYMQVFNQMNGSTVNIDLDTGETFSSNSSVIDHGSIDLGNGWYRVYATHIGVSRDLWYIPVNSLYSDYLPSITTSGTVYVWGGQIEQRDTVTAYTKTEGAPITKYQPKLMTAAADDARFDHDPLTGESKGLLIEEQRTNLISYSQQIEQQTSSSANFNKWVVAQSNLGGDVIVPHALVDLNAAIAPDGTLSASKFYSNEYLLPPAIYQQVYVTDTTPETLTFSVFAKAGQANRYLQLFTGAGDIDGDPFANFNLFDGTISRDDDSIGSIENYGNGWYRCIITFTTVSTSGIAINPVIYLIDDDNAERAPQMTGDDYSGLYVWGAQLEAGSFPTSYIKTTGASATRSADNASITGENFSSWYRQDEGSIYADILPNYAIRYGAAALTIGATKDSLSFSPGSTGQVRFFIRTNDTSQAVIEQTGFTENNLKLSAAYASNDAYFSVNGETIGEDTGVLLPSVDDMRIGQDRFRSEMCAHIKKIAYYPQRLTNEQLQNLTK